MYFQSHCRMPLSLRYVFFFMIFRRNFLVLNHFLLIYVNSTGISIGIGCMVSQVGSIRLMYYCVQNLEKSSEICANMFTLIRVLIYVSFFSTMQVMREVDIRKDPSLKCTTGARTPLIAEAQPESYQKSVYV
jgi:hypothetical protein